MQTRFVSLFVEEMAKSGKANGRSIAIKAGYSEKSAHVTASKMKKHKVVQEEIARQLDMLANGVKASDVRIISEIACIGFSNIKDYFDFDGETLTVKDFEEISETKMAAVNEIIVTNDVIKIKLHDKMKALTHLSRIKGLETKRVRHEFADKPLKIEFADWEEGDEVIIDAEGVEISEKEYLKKLEGHEARPLV